MVKKMIGLPPGTTTTSSLRDLHATGTADVLGDRLAQSGNPAEGP